MRIKKTLIAGLAIAGLALSLTACGQASENQAASGDAVSIGVLFPDNKTPQWETRFYPSIRDSIKKECPSCEVVYANVASDATEQQNQAEAMLTKGIKALIFAPVNADASKAIVAKANASGVPVIGFGSVPEGDVQAFVGVDVTELGRIQGTSLLEGIKAGGDPKRGCVVALNGDAQTPAIQEFLDGRAETLDDSVDICYETNITNWDPANAQTAMDQAIAKVGANKIIGVYTMNDGIASGASAALKNAGVKKFPPIGGQDSDLAALQRIISGEQYFSVNANTKAWGDVAGPVALKAARGEKLTSDKTVKNSTVTMPWFPTPSPFGVTLKNIQDGIINSGYFTYEEICTSDFKAKCDAAGLKPAA